MLAHFKQHLLTHLLPNKSTVLTRRPFKWAAVERDRRQIGIAKTRPGVNLTGLLSSSSADI